MTNPQAASFSTSLEDGTVVLESNHSQLATDELGWIYTILEGTPSQIVLQADLSAIESSTRTIVVKSALELEDGGYAAWNVWTGGTIRTSETLSHEQALRVEVEVSEAGTVVSTGSGYFRIWDEGGGGDG